MPAIIAPVANGQSVGIVIALAKTQEPSRKSTGNQKATVMFVVGLMPGSIADDVASEFVQSANANVKRCFK